MRVKGGFETAGMPVFFLSLGRGVESSVFDLGGQRHRMPGFTPRSGRGSSG